MGLILKNGIVFDPKNEIRGEKMDLFIKDGKMVSEKDLGKKAETIDLAGKVVFPGGVDIHAHVAGSKVNSGRLFRPEDSRMRTVPRTNVTRAGSGFSVPTTFLTGYTYSEMGYTTVIEPAVPPLKARHTHEEFHDIPMLDKTGLLLLGNNHQVIEYLKAGDLDRCKEWVAWMLLATKCYGIKCVYPGGFSPSSNPELWILYVAVDVDVDVAVAVADPNFSASASTVGAGSIRCGVAASSRTVSWNAVAAASTAGRFPTRRPPEKLVSEGGAQKTFISTSATFRAWSRARTASIGGAMR